MEKWIRTDFGGCINWFRIMGSYVSRCFENLSRNEPIKYGNFGCRRGTTYFHGFGDWFAKARSKTKRPFHASNGMPLLE